MAKAYRRFSAEFKLRLVESYLTEDGSLKGLATQVGIDHSLLHYWVKRYHAGKLTLDIAREDAICVFHPSRSGVSLQSDHRVRSIAISRFG